ncbi:MAG: PadR family transcriptional regulator [Candidatus Omnitrophica bacterium]|nr:PadR family transcriptional regulator [Candidatus Omnitrophota bacterium]
MIRQDLIILGLLKDSSKHGYEIKKNIAEVMSLYTPVITTSIYYPLKNLERKNFITRKRTKIGRRPERYVYSLTEKGKEEFDKLLNKNFLIIQRPYLNLDLSLYFCP